MRGAAGVWARAAGAPMAVAANAAIDVMAAGARGRRSSSGRQSRCTRTRCAFHAAWTPLPVFAPVLSDRAVSSRALTAFSMRRSGISHIRASRTYAVQASGGLTKANPIPARQKNGESLPLMSRPSASARAFVPGAHDARLQDVIGERRHQQRHAIGCDRQRGELVLSYPSGGERNEREPEQPDAYWPTSPPH